MKSGHLNSSLSFENKMTLPFTGIAGYRQLSEYHIRLPAQKYAYT